MTSDLIDRLTRVIFDAEHTQWLIQHGHPVIPENLDGAWTASERWKDGRIDRARAAAVAALEFLRGQTVSDGCHSIGGVHR